MSLSADRIAIAREKLYSAVLSDVIDELGDKEHSMNSGIRPLDDDLIVFGPVRTGLFMERFNVEEGVNPYELEMDLIDSLKKGEVVVLAAPGSDRLVPWGELLSTACVARGVAGCITDGLARDVRLIREMKFPVFCRGMGPLDSKGRAEVKAIDVPIRCGGVDLAPGDWVFADVDGVVVIREHLLERAVELALEKVSGENLVREELATGASVREVFDRHGIL